MEYSSSLLQNLVDKFVKLPGIGKRTAIRLVLHLLKQDKKELEEFGLLIAQIKDKLKYCNICHNIADEEICDICNDKSRDKGIICIVEDLRDVLSIENTNQYKGLYHVLGGLISPVDGVNPDMLKISSLIERVKTKDIREIIFALSATMEGDTTAFFITKQLKDMPIKFSLISRGISIGSEIEFADEITLGRSIQFRVPYPL